MNTAVTIREKVRELADRLPGNATWDDVIEEVRLRKAVEEGIAEADRGEFAKPEDVSAAFAKWGAQLA